MSDTRIKVKLDMDARGRKPPRELHVLVPEQVQTADIDERVGQSAQVLGSGRRGVDGDVLVSALL